VTEERRLAAIMFCDVCGFSRIMGENETRALAVVGMATSCIESAVGMYGGRVIKKLGDGLLCEFPSAVNAVRCAIEVQKAVADHDRTAEPDQQFQMRIGIHVGDVVVADGDILGDGVNVASRIQPLAEPGGICISRDVFDLVKSRVSIETINLGPHDLKNISRQIDIYKVLIDAVEGGSHQTSASPATKSPARPGRRRKAVWIVTGSIAAVMVLIALLAFGRARQARRTYETATREAHQLATDGKTADAIQRLKAYPPKYRKTVWQKKIDEDVGPLQLRLARETIADRQHRFFKAVADDNRSEAFRFVDPEALRTGDMNMLWLVYRVTAGLLKLGGGGPDSFRIESVDVAADGQSARVYLKLFKKPPEHPEGIWEDVPPLEWVQAQGEWYWRPESRPPPRAARPEAGQHELRRLKKPLARP